ncbi:MAG: hypothetical protein JSV78_09120 [Phycisphaerales bacterium]|nr:MAG: hypothetical protein JSV78_09120 [Phycisphaerales bacterium]
MVCPERYSVDQILTVLHRISFFASLEYDSPLVGLPEMKLGDTDDWMALFEFRRKREYRAFFQRLQCLLRFKAEDEEWVELARDKTTMRELAEFIAARASYREIKPVNLLGRECLEAGIFREMEQITNDILNREVHVGPSTTLRGVMSKEHCKEFASRLFLFFPDIYSAEHLWRRSRISNLAGWSVGLFIVLVLGGVVLLEVGQRLPWGIGALLLVPGACAGMGALCLLPVMPLLGLLAMALGIGKGPFDRTIRTYRDLVRALNAERGFPESVATVPPLMDG